MKKSSLLLLVAAALTGAPVMAHELDEVSAPSAQVELAKELPQTIVLRISKTDPSKIDVVHVKEKLPAGKKLDAAAFQKLALNSEQTGIAFDSTNELDVRSSTSSWSFGVYADYDFDYGYRPYRRAYSAPRSFYRSDYRRSYSRDESYYYRRATYRSYRPVYRYADYDFSYSAYYGYSDRDYDYEYCDWY